MSRSTPDENADLFDVAGAGHVSLHLRGVSITGGAKGIAIGCSWGSHGYTGGVMDITEVSRMRDALSLWLAEHSKRTDSGELRVIIRRKKKPVQDNEFSKGSDK